MNFSEQCFRIFEQATEAYHVTDNVDATVHNPYAVKSIEFYLYLKNWIDAVQWHLEDIIRNPEIDPVEALEWNYTYTVGEEGFITLTGVGDIGSGTDLTAATVDLAYAWWLDYR